MLRLFWVAFGVAFLSTASSALAETPKTELYTFDRVHTQVIFVADHLGMTKSFGKFTDLSGELSLNREDLSKSFVNVEIKTPSLDLNDKTWNEHMTGENFLNVAKFPLATFKSTAVNETGPKTADMIGDLTLLGITKPITLHVTFNKEMFNSYTGKQEIGFSATGTIRRSDWGMTYGLPGIGDDVNLIIEAAFQKKSDPVMNASGNP